MRTPKNKLFSIKIEAGSRTYRFDVRTSVDGIKYLVIKELRGDVKEGQVMIFKEHIQVFRKGVRKALRFIKKSNTKTYDVEQQRHDYPKAYAKWTQGEDTHLRSLYAQGESTKELAIIFQRKPSAIRSRLKKLDKLGLL